MTERKRLYLLMFLSFVIGIIGIYLSKVDLRNYFSDLTADYSATIRLDKTISLEEKYYFNNKTDQFRMLYRYWKVPLVLPEQEGLNYPFIRLVDGNGNGDFYAKAYNGEIFGHFSKPESKELVRTFANKNEVGIVNPDHFQKGYYILNADFEIFPPLETDNKNLHLNLKLADQHIPYPKVDIKIIDNQNLIEKIYPHLPDFDIVKMGSVYLIEGKAPLNGLVEVEFLLKPADITGFKRFIPDILKKTEEANEDSLRTILNILENLLTIVILFFPFLLALFYIKFGSEKNFVVPEFLSFVPNPERKPYFVNLIFNGDSFKGDENAFYATLLDLHRREKIKIEENGEVSIYILDTHSSDPYERKLLLFLQRYSQNVGDMKVFFPSYIESLAKRYAVHKDISNLSLLKRQMDNLFNYKNPKLSSEFVNNTGKIIVQITGVSIVVVSIVFVLFSLINGWSFKNIDLYPLTILFLTLSFQTMPVLLTPTQFLGKWKKDYYKEKLMWDSFRRFLSNLAMIKKYSPNDIEMWREWLVYGTALGVAEKVEEAMKVMNVQLPEIEKERKFKRKMHDSYTYTGSQLMELRSPSASGGGSFGGGGGFGGGGAGGR